jgi:hypothetical protein
MQNDRFGSLLEHWPPLIVTIFIVQNTPFRLYFINVTNQTNKQLQSTIAIEQELLQNLHAIFMISVLNIFALVKLYWNNRMEICSHEPCTTSMNGAPYKHLYGEAKWWTALTVRNFKQYFFRL